MGLMRRLRAVLFPAIDEKMKTNVNATSMIVDDLKNELTKRGHL